MLLLAGCGGSGESATTTPTQTPVTESAASAGSAARLPEGDPDPRALVSFACAKGSKGKWNARGVVANSSQKSVTYQVSVLVGGPTGQARTVRLANIAPDGSAEFKLQDLPAQDDATVCNAQVLALS